MTALRVLLVEDEAVLRMVTADMLREAGFKVVEAWDGDQAAQFLDGLEPFDMLITDVQMPGLRDGIAVATYARSRQSCIPVLVVSGQAQNLTARLDILGPLVVFLQKPYRIGEIVRVSKQLTLAA